MKVLSQNIWFNEVRCWFCASILLVEKEDIKKRIGDMGNDVFYCDCPICHAENIIHKTRIFSEILERL